jgi:hypothetical protein
MGGCLLWAGNLEIARVAQIIGLPTFFTVLDMNVRRLLQLTCRSLNSARESSLNKKVFDHKKRKKRCQGRLLKLSSSAFLMEKKNTIPRAISLLIQNRVTIAYPS